MIAFITDSPLRDIRVHHGEPTAPPRIAPGRGQPWWEGTAAVHGPSADPLLDAALA
jgi:hypothetical protein